MSFKRTNSKGDTVQVFHAVFDGSTQLTAWRSCRVATMAALHRSSHRAKRTVGSKERGPLRVRDRGYVGLTIRSKAFVTRKKEPTP